MIKSVLKAGAAGIVAAAASVTGPAWAADFYKGKKVTLYVAASPGGGYATYARAIARHWSRYIPGEPDFVIKHKALKAGMTCAITHQGDRTRAKAIICE